MFDVVLTWVHAHAGSTPILGVQTRVKRLIHKRICKHVFIFLRVYILILFPSDRYEAMQICICTLRSCNIPVTVSSFHHARSRNDEIPRGPAPLPRLP